jgi:hypothetical protein
MIVALDRRDGYSYVQYVVKEGKLCIIIEMLLPDAKKLKNVMKIYSL